MSERAEKRALRVCGLPANGEGHHPGDPDCICTELAAEIRAAKSAARAEERKRCAAICRMLAKAHEDNGNSVIAVWSASGCALAIERPTFQEQPDEQSG